MADRELSKQGIVKYVSIVAARKVARTAVKALPLKNKNFKKSEVKTILFIQLYGIGDYLMSTPAISAIAKEFPKAKKILLCKKHSSDIAKLNPKIDEILTDSKKIGRPDLAVSLNDSVESTIIALKSRPKYLIGFLKGENVEANFKIKKFCGGEKKPWVENYLLIPKAIGIRAKNKAYSLKIKKSKKVFEIIRKKGLSNFAVLNPNTREGAGAKNWGNKNYALLAEKLIENGVKIVFCGGKGEHESKKTIDLIKSKNKTEKVTDLTGKLSLGEVVYLLSRAKLFVGNDTGLMHISLAVKCPTITVFGPTNSKILFPKNSDKTKEFAFQVKNKEWPSYTRGTFGIKQNQNYMDSIAPETVFRKSLEMIK
ncbi:MAG: glycosyltransferase family 9 protein [archaeon]|jgi:ADP-heptose:LPS heptosyltransferase